MKERDLRRRLGGLEPPRADEARERAWQVVSAAFGEREPIRPTRARLRPLVSVAIALALLAAALSPAGRAVLDTVRDTVAPERIVRARPALFSLPADGRLLVDSQRGAWVVQRNGSKRLLGAYRESSWSPTGRFVVVAGRSELVALEPGGRVRWSLARPGVSRPRWGGTRTDTRIAYGSGTTLRVVAGDGRGDRLLARRVAPVAPAWRPGTGHVLAFVDPAGRIQVVAVDRSDRRLWSSRPTPAVQALEWSREGALLLVRARRSLSVYNSAGRRLFELLGDGSAPIAAAALGPSGRSVAFVQTARGRSSLWVVPRLRPDASAARRVFTGAGRFTDVAWSPDGRWLLLAWADADQWLFLRSTGVQKLVAVSDLRRQFRTSSFPRIGGWCCAS